MNYDHLSRAGLQWLLGSMLVEKPTHKQFVANFITAARAVALQGCRSMSPHGVTCAYRSQEGLKCAIGHLIPDNMYRVTLESQGVVNMFSGHGNSVEGALRLQVLSWLQRTHDTNTGPGTPLHKDPDFGRKFLNALLAELHWGHNASWAYENQRSPLVQKMRADLDAGLTALFVELYPGHTPA